MNNAAEMTDSPPRLGPRPLALHLGLATTAVAGSLAAVPLRQRPPVPWPEGLAIGTDDMAARLEKYGSADLIRMLAEEGSEKVQEMISGIRLYHHHPYRRAGRNRPVLWQEGTTRLLDGHPGAAPDAPVLLLVPSLVNRAYILDLMPGRSLVDHLAGEGIRPLLVDWDAPGESEKDFRLDDYIFTRICPLIDFAAERFPGAKLHLAGYCMGGTLTAAAARLRQEKLASFIALAAPWDFHAGLAELARQLLARKEVWDNVLEGFGEMPVDLLQALFVSLDPNLGLRKFSMFAGMDMTSERATEFVALEDWLNDGTALTKGVAADCFEKWYGRNDPVHNCWTVGGETVLPSEIKLPALIAAPKVDKLVPRPSALALAAALPKATVITPPSGHIGMVTSRKARDGLWREMTRWIRSV